MQDRNLCLFIKHLPWNGSWPCICVPTLVIDHSPVIFVIKSMLFYTNIHLTNLIPYFFLYRFTQSGNLKMHRLVHSAEKQFQCTDCEKAFTTVVQLRSHRRQHTGERPVPKATCSECGKKCTNNGDLKVHMRQHTGERPFACTTCNRRFLMHTHLLIHVRTHTGEKPYKCLTCPKSFSSSTMLQKHSWIHTGEKRYACSHCGKRFTQSSGRNSHQRIHEKQQAVAVVVSRQAMGNDGEEAAVKAVNEDVKLNYEIQLNDN